MVDILIFVLGAIAANRGGDPPAILGFRGASGAIQFLLANALFFGGLYAAFLVFTRLLGQKAIIDAFVWHFPMIGPCVRALVVGRFALAMQLTLDAAVPLAEALRLSFDATGNAAFASQADAVQAAVEDGDDLTVALGSGRMFPTDFLTMIAVGEEGGRLVEIMRHQAANYQDEARRLMQGATRMASGLVWLVYAVFMVGAIFRIAGSVMGNVGM